MLRNEGDRLTRVVVCPPAGEYLGVTEPEVHGMSEPAVPDRIGRQYGALRGLLADAGAEVVEVEELQGHPNSAFTRDTALVTPSGHVRVRMGLPARLGEGPWMSDILTSMGVPCIGEISEPGSLEGGDVILAGDVAFVGCSSRSNEAGVAQLTGILQAEGYEVRVAPVSDLYMHVGGLMSAIGPHRVLCCRGLFPEGYFEGFERVEIDWYGPSCANVICLRDGEVIANSSEARPTMEALEDAGILVHGLDLSEYRKGGGGPTCIILPVERA
ncbi:dimethylarginine dimethylaminohydrolase family protein [Gemmatimonadota bacterium]